ncbi:hypothetical protein M569_11026 [Genlisea aurea]|uniref:Uncharacterized protein n=1 Tax=Genlisea aurea TaxID=192259 RepID=S8DLH7_9LAMI|nr:hypothetical protein M569_11026 [Genlisea aurea]
MRCLARHRLREGFGVAGYNPRGIQTGIRIRHVDWARDVSSKNYHRMKQFPWQIPWPALCPQLEIGHVSLPSPSPDSSRSSRRISKPLVNFGAKFAPNLQHGASVWYSHFGYPSLNFGGWVPAENPPPSEKRSHGSRSQYSPPQCSDPFILRMTSDSLTHGSATPKAGRGGGEPEDGGMVVSRALDGGIGWNIGFLHYFKMGSPVGIASHNEMGGSGFPHIPANRWHTSRVALGDSGAGQWLPADHFPPPGRGATSRGG